MGRKKNDHLVFRFYELPEGESALTLLGESWVGVYGRSDTCLHFHNLFEIGYCHYGRGKLLLGQRELPYEDAMISAIPANYPHGTYSDSVDSWEFLFFDPDALCREMFPDDPNRRTETLYTIDYGVLMMGVLFCSLPTVIVFFILQKQFAQGITGAIK